MIHAHFLIRTLLLSFLIYIGSAHALSDHSLATIEEAAEQHVRALLPATTGKVLLQADRLDPRLHLSQCNTPLQAFLPSGANLGTKATVGVRCNDGNTWSVYVPVSIESEIDVLSLNKSVARNTPISALDVDIRTQRVPGLMNRYLKDVKSLQNKRSKRDLPAGTVLTPDMLQAELLVKRGQQVTILAEVAGIEVRNQGVALSDGSPDMRVQVKNLGSAKVIEGVVDVNGVIRVSL